MTSINPYSLLGSGGGLAGYLNKYDKSAGNLGLSQDTGTAEGDTLALSPKAQALLAQAKNKSAAQASPSSGEDEPQNKAQASAQALIAGFFDDNGIDIAKASKETLSLFEGLIGVINDMQAPTTNAGIDQNMFRASGGRRSGVTLEEGGHTVSFVVTYENGKPASMKITNVTGASAETATVKLGRDADGTPATVTVTNEKNTYNRFGGKMSGIEREALHFDLYATGSAAAS